MKTWLIALAALLPLSGMANTLNNNNVNQPGYNPSQQRMQTQMQTQQQQQQRLLHQDQQGQTKNMQRQLRKNRDSTRQQVLQSQPGQNTQQNGTMPNNN